MTVLRRTLGRLNHTMQRSAAFGLLALGLILAPAAAWTPAQAQAVAQADPPFMDDLERLSEILGSVHYLAALCSDTGTSPWRGEMQRLMEAEFKDEVMRRRVVARFNTGYRSYASTHKACTGSAELTLNRFLDEGAEISDRVNRRYGR